VGEIEKKASGWIRKSRREWGPGKKKGKGNLFKACARGQLCGRKTQKGKDTSPRKAEKVEEDPGYRIKVESISCGDVLSKGERGMFT